MKVKISLLLIFIAVLIFGGCIPSLHPLYSDDTLIFSEALLGKWICTDNSEDQIWQFSKAGQFEYDLRILQDEKEGRFIAHLLELDGKMYLDLYPSENKTMDNLNDVYKMHLIAAHTFLFVNLSENNLQLNWFMQDLLDDDPNMLQHEKLNEDQIVLTASTEDLQRFVIEHANEIDPNGMEFTKMEQLFTQEDIIRDDNLLGRWETEGGDTLSFKDFNDNNEYNVTFIDHDENKHDFVASAIRINDLTLLAVFFSEPTDNEVKCGQDLIPDFFVIAEQAEPMLYLKMLDYDQAREFMITGKLPFETIEEYDFEGTRIESIVSH